MLSFLDSYRLQTGNLKLYKKEFSMDTLLKDIVEIFTFTDDTHTVTYDGTLSVRVHADKERIGQVVTNLITNAIKYSPKADKVLVDLKKEGKKIIVSVQDFGKGIPKVQQEKIFERFYRSKSKEDEKVEGLGLGLYISSEIVREHKGKMWVESNGRKGSTFYFSIPLK